MTKEYSIVLTFILGACMGIGSTYLFMSQNGMLVQRQETKMEKVALKEIELTYTDIEASALLKWQQQGYVVQGGFGKPGMNVPGKPGCLKHDYILTKLTDRREPAMSEIEVCGKQFTIGNVVALSQLINEIRGN